MRNLRYIGLSAGKEFISMILNPGLKPCATNRASLRDFSKAIFQFIAIALSMAMTSCNQMELCWDHDAHAPGYGINVAAEWNLNIEHSYDGGMPEGLRVIRYTENATPDTRNIAPEGGYVPLMPGHHSLLFYNNDTEFLIFNDVNQAAKITATTRTRVRSTYNGSPFLKVPEMTEADSRAAEHTVNQPDFLWGHYIADYEATKNLTPPVVPITMQPLVFNYEVRLHFSHGLHYVALARGALAGMAASVYLSDGHTGEDVATVLFDIETNPEQFTSSEREGEGELTVLVNTFGAPNYPNPFYSTRSSYGMGLNLELLLHNGKIYTLDFDVTSQIIDQPRGGVIDIFDIVIPDDIGLEGSGAFDINVSGWGEYQDVNLDFGTPDE